MEDYTKVSIKPKVSTILFCIPGGPTSGHIMRVRAILEAYHSMYSELANIRPVGILLADDTEPLLEIGVEIYHAQSAAEDLSFLYRMRPSIIIWDTAPDLFPATLDYIRRTNSQAVLILRHQKEKWLHRVEPYLELSTEIWIPHQWKHDGFEPFFPVMSEIFWKKTIYIGDVFNCQPLLSKDYARSKLGICSTSVAVLLGLGQDAQADWHLNRLAPILNQNEELELIAFRSGNPVPGIRCLNPRYPLSIYLPAFDAAVASVGYNLVRELLYANVPSIFSCLGRTRDNCQARLESLRRLGIGVCLDTFEPLKLYEMLNSLLASSPASSRSTFLEVGGAKKAASRLFSLLT